VSGRRTSDFRPADVLCLRGLLVVMHRQMVAWIREAGIDASHLAGRSWARGKMFPRSRHEAGALRAVRPVGVVW